VKGKLVITLHFFTHNKMISPFSIQKVQDRIDVVELVGNFIRLKKRGVNYLGNCPFHNEKSPSFPVSPAKGIYKCFGCGKAGNAITFVQEHEKLSYPEAIRYIAKYYNIELEETQMSAEVVELQKVEESLRIVNNFAQQYFTTQLNETEEGQNIGVSYFKERGFRQETLDKFLLGYSPESRYALFTAATEKGYQKDLLLKCGLINSRSGIDGDNYSGRVIFPIQNMSGKVIGFGARILKKSEKAPKYINTPENEIYSKSKTLYGLFQARTAISKQNECLLVEGYTDVISLHQAGVENVVASSGTALTVEQLKLISRFSKNLTIIYDGDAAGIKAALRGLDMAVEEGLNVQLVLLPDGQDPDSFVQAEGASGLNNYITENKKDIILFLLEISLKEAGQDSVKKAELINEIASTISKMNKVEEFTKQQDYIKRCSQLLHIDEAGLIVLVNKKIREKITKSQQLEKNEAERLEQRANPEIIDDAPTENDAALLLQKDYQQEKALIRVLIEYGDMAIDNKTLVHRYIRKRILADAEFANEKWGKLYSLYLNYVDTFGQAPPQDFFMYHEEDEVKNNAIEATFFPYEISDNWEKEYKIHVPKPIDFYEAEVKSIILYFSLRKLKTVSNDILELLNNASLSEEEALLHMQSLKEIREFEKQLLGSIQITMYR
jgi:DNA primase